MLTTADSPNVAVPVAESRGGFDCRRVAGLFQPDKQLLCTPQNDHQFVSLQFESQELDREHVGRHDREPCSLHETGRRSGLDPGRIASANLCANVRAESCCGSASVFIDAEPQPFSLLRLCRPSRCSRRARSFRARGPDIVTSRERVPCTQKASRKNRSMKLTMKKYSIAGAENRHGSCGVDDEDAKRVAAALIRHVGFDPVDAGALWVGPLPGVVRATHGRTRIEPSHTPRSETRDSSVARRRARMVPAARGPDRLSTSLTFVNRPTKASAASMSWP